MRTHGSRIVARCLAVSVLIGFKASAQTLQPVIARVQIVFSMVSHYSHIGSRVSFYNTSASPSGNSNYAVPHLVYEPLVTLYNPYNQPLTLSKARIRIADPPVGFAFKKNSDYLRPEFGSGQFLGLARFQIANESNPSARKSMTLLLREKTGAGVPGASIVLQPGESRTFATWVENNWTWGLETAGGFTARSFFDWHVDNDFTNRDGRTLNAFGAEAVPSSPGFPHNWDPRAGFQSDALSSASRPLPTRYDFEIANNWTGNWVAIKLNDTVTVQAKAMRTNPPTGPDCQVDLLKGQVATVSADLRKAFPMSVAGIIQNGAQPVVTRTYRVGDLLQTPSDTSPGGKAPFAVWTMIAKTNALQQNAFYQTPAVPAEDLYELHFDEMTFFNPNPVLTSDVPTAAPQVKAVSRVGNTLYVDFTGRPDVVTWKVRGTSSLAAGFNDILTGVMPGPPGTGIHKAIIDLTGRGDRYFIRIEE
jgi:hypothetical protein